MILHLRLCCELKKRQSRHEERLLRDTSMYLTPLGLALKNVPDVFVVILNKRRATQTGARLPGAPAYSPSVDISGAFSVTTRRAGTIFAAACVVNHLCRKATRRAFRLVGHKNSRQQWWI